MEEKNEKVSTFEIIYKIDCLRKLLSALIPYEDSSKEDNIHFLVKDKLVELINKL